MGEWLHEKLNDRRIRYAATAAVVVLLVLLAIVIRDAIADRTYTGYRVEKAVQKTDSVSKFEYVDGNVVRYSKDGAALINKALETVWTAAFSLENPRIDVCQGQILFYDRLGTQIHLYNQKEQNGSFQTELPILTARVSGHGTVAALLRDGEKVNLVYYTRTGEPIAAGESSMRNPGYPVSLSLSSDGMSLAVSYLTAADGGTGTTVRFYNFGTDGQSKQDNMTAEFTWAGVFAPEVQYLSGDECAIFRDDGFTIVRGTSSPAESKTVTFHDDICSVFHDGTHLGFITRSADSGHRYQMSLYSTGGNLLSSAYVDSAYEWVRVCGDEVILSSSSEFSVYSTGGKCRFRGRLKDGTISDALRIGRDRILILTDQRMEVIALQ